MRSVGAAERGLGPLAAPSTCFTILAAALVALGGCGGSDEHHLVSFVWEGTGSGALAMTNDADQAAFGGDASAGDTEAVQLDAGSDVEIRATAASGSHLVGFGGDCAGGENPLEIVLESKKSCTVRFDLGAP